MKTFSLRSCRAALLALGALSLGVGALTAADNPAPDQGTVSGPAVSSRTPGATDTSGTGPDTSQGITHARSSGGSSAGASLNNNSSPEPQGYGTITGPGTPSNAPGARDETGTGTDTSQGVTHAQSSPSANRPESTPSQ